MYETFRLGCKRDLEMADIYCSLKEDSSKVLGDLISEVWLKEEKICNESKIRKPSLIRVLAKSFGRKFIVIGLWQIFDALFIRILQVLIFAKVLSYFNNKNEMSKSEAFYWASGFAFCEILTNIITHHRQYAMAHLGMKFRIACSAIVYRKCLRLSKASEESNASTGQIINLLSNDVEILNYGFYSLNFLWIAPIQAIIITVILYQRIKISCFMGILIIFMLFPLQAYMGKWVNNLTEKASLRTDTRLSLMDEIIHGVQVIKMYAWEKSFSHLVDKARAKEMSVLRKISFIDAITICFDTYIPRVCVFVIILTYVLFENHVSAEQVYMVTAFYNELRTSINIHMALGIQFTAKTLVSIKRLERLLMRKEIHPTIDRNIIDQTSDPNIAVKLTEASTKWSPEIKKNTIHNISFNVKRGSLSAIIGQVGSGKSSLLHVILDELPLSSGSIQVSGTIAYVSQEPWVFASSIRQNILFGLPMDKKRYEEVVKVCQLVQDFSMFPFGDKTLIGEKGITLSGGQKSRINLARAVYRDADIYLLDDPLSAVDTHVGRKIFDDCISKYLKGKTIILVTHQLQYLKNVDRIFILNSGSVEMEGNFNSLHKSGLDLLKILPITDDNDEKGHGGYKGSKDTHEINNDQFITLERNLKENKNFNDEPQEIAEHRAVGKTSGRVYLSYLKAVGNIWIVFSAIFLSILYQIVATSGDIFLASWVDKIDQSANATSLDGMDNMWYIQTFSILSVMAAVLANAFFLMLCEMCMRSSQNLHSFMFYSVMRARMSFFHEHPSGRILNRFSKDMGAVDKQLPSIIEDIVQAGLLVVAVMVINISASPWLLIPTAIVASIFYAMIIVYIKTSRSLKRLESTNRSPVFNHISATLQGLTTVRAFKAETILTQEFDNYQNLHSSAWYMFTSGARAFAFYLQFICSLYIGFVIFLFVSISDYISAGDAGLVITQCLLLSGILQFGFRQVADLENQMTSIERIREYSHLEEEPPLETSPENKPLVSWPSEGRVEFKEVCLSYHPLEALVLKNLNFLILPKEKIGIVGRTGAGKSSLIAALFQLAYLKGEIYIDGVATSKLGLHDVRSNISIIPQEPLLFAGSLRRNLDPFDNYSDDDLWQALAEVELKNFIMELYAGLNAKVSDGGSNFSVGQRQLLCLARAIVRNKKILVLDEATANVDLQTDKLIQKTIRWRFKDCTVFIIAHRLNTVMDCDKFIVMDSGSMVEFGHPYEILRKKGYLYNMVQQTGPEMAEVLMNMAESANRH
ncbi:probable multidrug resistance-associated protein lethal(2)03659 isoform X2 [Belonocnema kinseyi]|nr:probable multidrug resistance-associated protein lethal(2)03659 isoform X2 [Belonocnema kinseyi]XP_033225032.1 probable multidrug resistance-associated protein lethal(2)03659 isoform X2 [Belonocnema kinseyi]